MATLTKGNQQARMSNESDQHYEARLAIGTLKHAKGTHDQIRHAMATLYKASNATKEEDADIKETLQMIGILDEKEFPNDRDIRDQITVSKMNVARNKEAHSHTLDYMARQILFNGGQKDKDTRNIILEYIIHNKNTSNSTIVDIIKNYKDSRIAEEGEEELNKRKAQHNELDKFLRKYGPPGVGAIMAFFGFF